MENEMPKGKTLSERTIDFGMAVIDLCETMPRTLTGRHIADQLLRSATSVAANYAEASEAESPVDFVHKMKLAQKELKESRVWLIFASHIHKTHEVDRIMNETHELLRMIGKSIITAKGNTSQKK